MMVVDSPPTTPMELYWFVWTMSMALCVTTGGTLWMPLLCVLSWDSQLLVCSLLPIICGSLHQFHIFPSHTGSLPVVRSGLGSPPNRSIFLDNVVCTGGEGNLTECGYTTITNCDRSEEAGVRCEGMEFLFQTKRHS